MKINRLAALWCALFLTSLLSHAQETNRFDAAPFATRLPEGNGLIWDDPREIHEVVVRFAEPVPNSSHPRLEYWGSRWPGQHLPKDREPGGGDVGWMELGNWYVGGWRAADTTAITESNVTTFTFHPVNEKEFPKVKGYDAPFRYTLKIRAVSDQPLPKIENIQAFTDSTFTQRTLKLAWKIAPSKPPRVDAFNGAVTILIGASPQAETLVVSVAQNPDPNTFDRTLVTVKNGDATFTFKVDDLNKGPLYLPEFGVAALPDGDQRGYAAIEEETKRKGDKTLYERVGELPEQTWKGAWEGMPPKKSHICFPLGVDGGRQKFRLDANGEVFIRWNDQYMEARPGRDSERLRIGFSSLQRPAQWDRRWNLP